MNNASGVRFVSPTFLAGFGIGVFIGVALALIAVSIARPQEENPQIIRVPVFPTATPQPKATPSPMPTPLQASASAAVHVGPGDEFATLGTLSRGDTIDILGRDFDGGWLAIRFPAGSSAQGWIPTVTVEGISFSNLQELAVLLPTPLPIEIITPPPFFGTPGTPGTGTPTPKGTSGPPPTTMDLVVFDVRALPDGRVRVVVLNAGPADLTRGVLAVTVRTLPLESETINYANILPAGATLALTTSSFTIGTEPVDVQVVIDPSASLSDPNRLNNVKTATLSRPPEVTPTPTETGPS